MIFINIERIILQTKLWYSPFFAFYGNIYLIYRKVRAYMCYMGFDTQKIILEETLNEYFSKS